MGHPWLMVRLTALDAISTAFSGYLCRAAGRRSIAAYRMLGAGAPQPRTSRGAAWGGARASCHGPVGGLAVEHPAAARRASDAPGVTKPVVASKLATATGKFGIELGVGTCAYYLHSMCGWQTHTLCSRPTFDMACCPNFIVFKCRTGETKTHMLATLLLKPNGLSFATAP